MKIPNGTIIAVEGIDGAGKTTLVDSLSRKLSEEGHSVIKLKEPGSTVLGDELREILLEGSSEGITTCPMSRVLLYLASMANTSDEITVPFRAGNVFIIDRWIHSTIAYQGATLGVGLVEDLVDITYIPYPDIVLYIDIPADLAVRRTVPDDATGILRRARDFLEIVRKNYLDIYEGGKGLNWRLLDGTDAPEQVLDAATKYLSKRFGGDSHDNSG